MTTSISRTFRMALVLGLSFAVPAAFAQVNSWTNPASASWEQSYWSLGTLPGTNQSVLLTNAGWKAVMISPNTVATAPQSLTVNSFAISSPTNSYNLLLLNYAGVGTPLVINVSNYLGSLTVASNSGVLMLASALEVHNQINPYGGDFGAFSI